jgi:predicted membrane protein
MKKVSKFVYWTPRILSIIFICFLALMSLDIFDMKLGFFGTIVGLFMHNIPTLALLVVLLISWKHEIVGGVAFILAGILYLVILFMNPFELYMLSWAIQIAGVAFFIGILFFVNWFKKKNRKSKGRRK